MGIFATRARHATDGAEAGGELSDELRVALPPRFEAVGEALASGPGLGLDLGLGSGSVDACTVVGRDLALDGVSLEETLADLRTTYRMVCGRDPDYADLQAISVAWSESTLGYLHRLSCEDPLTGLASLAHVRSRLSELYRGPLRESGGTRGAYALVVIDVPQPGDSARRPGSRADVLTHALRASRLGETARTVFSGTETIGRLGLGRIVVIAGRDPRLGQRIALLRRMLAGFDVGAQTSRVWIEGLPDSDTGAASLLDELARL